MLVTDGHLNRTFSALAHPARRAMLARSGSHYGVMLARSERRNGWDRGYAG